MKVYRDLVEDGVLVSKEIFDIAECTYTGKDMGERSITATIEFATPIDFQIGDYIKLPMQNLIRSTSGVNGSIASGSDEAEKFYIYTMPTIKKVARAMSNGKAFEHNVTFQSAQYELSCVQMRDLGNSMNADSVIYTGFDNVTFNGAAHELMERIMMVLKEAYHDSEGNPLWSYEISDTVNEDVNLALERFPISFSGNTVMDALLELNNKETINTTFFINNRKIYVGFKRPYFCRVTDGMSIDTNPSSQLFTFQYGKTSDKGVALQYGGLYDITKTVGKEVPITKLFAYGASRNLNRYYCSDRVKGGRYVNRLMLPSFDADGKTDFIISEDALQRYGVREATKQFEEIYPSIRYATYGDIRQVKYCIKVKASGRSEDIDQSSYPIARIQCYKVVEGEITGVNKLVEAAPPDDLAIYIHAMDKTVKVVLYGGATDEEAIAKQKAHDTLVPTRVYSGAIPGSCFIVHDRGFDEAGTAYENADRSAWFTSLEDLSGFTEKQKEEIKLNQINYTDTFWLTDLYIFNSYDQSYFSRDGYSAWSWARLNNKYSSEKGHIASDSVVVNEIVHVEPITISDTNMTADGIDKRQSTFDIYLRDLGFTINEQNDFGDMVFLQNGTVKVSILDGLLAGQEFEISGSINSTSPSCICAFNDDGTRNEAFFEEPDYTTDGTNPQTPYDAFEKGAIWRIRLNRTNVDEADYANLNLAMPTKEINAKQGDHLVLLDIFMPDIYIHAAENRLLREARKYLEANDNGSISYAVNFDKVRMQQIPNYALQMREGLNLRVVDEDLNIRTENNGRYIADYRDNKIFSSTESDYNRVWLSANTPIDFTRGKYYTIEFELNDDSSFDTSATNAFALLKTKNDATIAFNPSYSVNKAYLDNGKIAVTIKFNLPDNFDDSSIYYPSLLLVSEISSNMRMYSHWLSYVFERDFDENTNILNYADFTIDSLTIKITDNSGNNEPIREITATLSEQTNATAWATLMNKVATTAKEGAQNKKALEEVVNTARRNYQALLSLKNSIFDPDGTCDQVFLQVMMQQVGADSMNYQLDNTRSGLSSDGQPVLFNCSCERGSDGYYHFKVYNNDTLRHYVYTQGSQAGNWEIPVGATGVDVQLNGTESYFVCLKCPKNDTVGQWICSTKQYAVNDPEDDTCWFFNWAILTVDSGGVYTLTETRGNAYMYGDNLVCGKISTIAGNSYFDLTHGNFVLGDGTGPALSYINGVLTISGSKGDAEKTLRDLGILQGDVEKAQSTADAAAQAAEDAKKQAEEEAAKVRDEYKAAIAESEGNMTKALTESVAEINGGIESLQKQVDGEVNSWFMEGEPANNYRPASEWTDQTLKDRHLGDTYTNILPADIDLSTLDNNGILQWVEQGYLQVGSASYEKTFAEQRQNTSNFCRTKCIMQLANAAAKITITPKDIPSGYTFKVLFSFYNAEKKYYVNDAWKYNSDNSSITYTVPAYGNAFGGSQAYYFSILFIAQDSNSNYLSITPSNIASIESDVVFANPEAGKSWRWCNYDDEDNTTFHWHPIADSDAVKALQEAAKAQSTADGKSTTFVVDEPTNYEVGDLWILPKDKTVNGKAYKQGTVLTANAASATFVASHWGEKVRYTDDTIANKAVADAKNADDRAAAAQASASTANNQLNAISSDSKIAVTEFATLETQLETIQAEYNDIIADANKYGVEKTSYNTAYDKAVMALKYHCGMAYSGTTKAPVNSDDKSITIITDTSKNYAYSNIKAYYDARQTILEAISDAADKVAENFAKEYSLEAIANMEIGGRNLLKNSKTLGIKGWSIPSDFVRESDKNIITTKQAGVWDAYVNIRSVLTNHSWKDKNITFSVQVKPSEDMQKVKMGIVIRLGNNTYVSDNYYTNPNIMSLKGGEWNTLYSTYKPVVDTEQLYNENYSFFLVVRCDDDSVSSGSVINLKDWKVEFGNKATDWTPAPEDVEAEIVDAKKDAADAAAAAKAAQDKLEVWSADGVITHFEVQGIKDELASILADYNEINADYTKYGLGTPDDFNTKYNTYKGQLDTLSTATADAPVKIPNDFATNQANYYTARTTAYNNISEGVNAYADSVARQQAQQALDGLELGGENLVLESKGDSNKNIMAYNSSSSNEFQYSCTPTKSDVYGDELKISLTCSTQGKYTPDSYSYTTCIWVQCKKETIKGKKYTISFDARLLPSSSADNCTVYFRAAGTGYSTTQMGKAIIDKTKKRYSITVDSNAESDSNVYSYFTLFLGITTIIYISNVKVEQGNKATGWSPATEDVDSKADAIKAIAEEAKEDAAESNAQLANMSNDSILTPQEKGSVADEWACIQEEYAQNSTNKTTAWGSATVAEWTTYNNAYTTLQTYVTTLELTDRAKNTTIVKSIFQTNFANYYSANVAFLNALSKKVAELEVAAMEIGGRNLLKNSNVFSISQWGTSNATYTKGTEYATMKMNVAEVMSTCTLAMDVTNNKDYIFNKKWKDKNICISVAVKSSKDIGLKVGIVIRNSSNVNINQNYYNAPYINVKAGEWTRIYSTYKCAIDADADNVRTIYLVIGSSTTCSIGDEFNIKDWKIEFGNKATDWTPAPEDVDAAIEKAGYVNMYDGGNVSKSYTVQQEVMSHHLCYISEGTYKTSCEENNGFDESIDPFHASTLVVVKAGQNILLSGVAALYNYRDSILGTYYWGNDITVSEGADIFIFFAQKDYIDYCISSFNEYGAEMPSGGSGTWTIRNIKIITDNASAIKIAQSKAEALDYLKAALTDGSTEIAGGLTMTNVLMLKNLEGFVTAGLSGLTTYNNKEDKVLIWGGCTYEEAYAAANNDDYNTGRGTITTLLKKDGTGKIGIFEISETQAVVKTNQGEVLIDGTDNNGGVYVKNKSGEIKAAIVNGKVEDYAPLEDEVIVSKNVNIKSDTYNHGVFAEGSSGTCTTSRSVTFNLKQHISVSEPCYCKVSVKVYGRLTQGFYNTSLANNHAAMQFTINGEAKSPLSDSIYQNNSGYAQNGISPGQYYMEISRPIQSVNNPMATYNNNVMYLTPNKDFEVRVDVTTLSSGAGLCLAKLTGDLTFVIEVTRLWSYGYEPKTIISTDGVMSAYDNKNFFIVKNTSNGQKIFAKGLSTTKGTAGSGELYVSKASNEGLVKSLYDGFAAISEVLQYCRYEGNNASAQENAKTACDNIRNALAAISIIANS